MKRSTLSAAVLAVALGFSGLAMANCADDAVDTCNTKHPNPNKSDHAYELYELCLKAQLGQKCPGNASIHPSSVDGFATRQKPVLPARSKAASKPQRATSRDSR